SWGQYDYILAHGLYSWVPSEVRDKIMRICQKNLRAEGIAFISYNALPGAHLRLMLREMMLFHVRNTPSPEEKLEQATALLSFLEKGQAKADDEYAVWLHKELERTLNLDRSHLFHDDLAGVNHPVYFHQFMAHAAQFNLQFLGEADFFEMSDHIYAPAVREALTGTAADRILREQYLDFLKCRRFRQTLLCRKEVKLRREADPSAVTKFYISSKAKEQKSGGEKRASAANDSPEQETVHYRTAKGAQVQTDYLPGRLILKVLEEAAPARVSFQELLQSVRAEVQEVKTEEIGGFLLNLFSAGVVEFKTHGAAAARAAGPRPQTSPVARWQVERSDTVTSLDHQLLEVEDEIGKQLIRSLDGTKNRAQIADELLAFLKARGALKDEEDQALRAKIERELEANLAKLARLGMLIA
ncbi:MAG TPA: methyltransferase regulatory domain-containing protein, partial [Verrucomicrobiae bacterium]|nr:methyltransferase regulatory domain-containing protein [Verrucomicrobiae bacterium]